VKKEFAFVQVAPSSAVAGQRATWQFPLWQVAAGTHDESVVQGVSQTVAAKAVSVTQF
jgi:hypothetical protein